MGGFASLSVEELLAVVHYERVQHGGLDPEAAETELHILEYVVENNPDLEWDAQSPEEITAILDEARAAEGGGEAATE